MSVTLIFARFLTITTGFFLPHESINSSTMSFPAFDSFQNQHGAADGAAPAPAPAGAPAAPDTTMAGQPDPTPPAFQGPPPPATGDASSASGQQPPAEGKTTLW